MRLLVVHCAAHKLNPGLSSSVGLSCSVCQSSRGVIVVFNLFHGIWYVCMWSSLWQILTRVLQTLFAKLFILKATKRPQNAGHKAAGAKRPHFAHGCSKVWENVLAQQLQLHFEKNKLSYDDQFGVREEKTLVWRSRNRWKICMRVLTVVK